MTTTKLRYGSAALAFAALAALALNFGEPSYARPADEAAFLGTANTEGRYNNLRKTAATITVTKDSEGKLSIRREARYTAIGAAGQVLDTVVQPRRPRAS